MVIRIIKTFYFIEKIQADIRKAREGAERGRCTE
jgi:hypothetical protein